MKTIFTFIAYAITLQLSAQYMQSDTVRRWTLQECIRYAMQNNISVKQTDIAARLATRDYQQAKMNRLLMWSPALHWVY
jgi:outer membrane protein